MLPCDINTKLKLCDLGFSVSLSFLIFIPHYLLIALLKDLISS